MLAAYVVSAQEDRKVPPRHPKQRLNRLNQFAAEWLNENLEDLPSLEK
jgi:hypothetical protein